MSSFFRPLAVLLCVLGTGAPYAAVDPDSPEAQAAYDARERARCSRVRVQDTFDFQGVKLIEMPDVDVPQLRLANLLLESRCEREAQEVIDRYRASFPNDYRLAVIDARMLLTFGSPERAETVLVSVLESRPTFDSAKVLLAGVRLEAGNFDETKRLLDSVPRRNPTDLWIFMTRLRMQSLRDDSPAMRAALYDVASNPHFPPNARESAAQTGKTLSGQTREQLEEFFQVQLGFESTTPLACKMYQLAQFMLSDRDFKGIRELLDSRAALEGNCLHMRDNRLLLAQAHLMEALAIGKHPNAQNAKHIARARELLRGNFAELKEIVSREEFAQMYALATGDPKQDHSQDLSKLCKAVLTMDTSAFGIGLDYGEDPQGECLEGKIIDTLMLLQTTKNPKWRTGMLHMLLNKGARPSDRTLQICGAGTHGDCREEMLPALEKWQSRNRNRQ
jgi:hypothetical protein